MKFVSTRGGSPHVSAADAILQGPAPDGGLYVPQELPSLSEEVFDAHLSYQESAELILRPFFEGDRLAARLPELCRSAFSFEVPLHALEENRLVLELFHGPTAAFKDFGARFLAAALTELQHEASDELTVVVATTGNTGGAMAAAFYGLEGLNVKILFPKGQVSGRQFKQLTCWNGNIRSYEVDGEFEDCQQLVKSALFSEDLKRKYRLTSGNSVNIGRLLPQIVYYIYGSVRFQHITGRRPIVIIPSGNVGNSVGAYYAVAMGAPIDRIVLAVNANRAIPDFLAMGRYEPRPSIPTLAKAMDVGDPSNRERLQNLFPDMDELRRHVFAYSVSDAEIKNTIRYVQSSFHYTLCPHTATAEYVREDFYPDEPTLVVATAHPAKFEHIVEPLIGRYIEIPESLRDLIESESRYTPIQPVLEQLF